RQGASAYSCQSSVFLGVKESCLAAWYDVVGAFAIAHLSLSMPPVCAGGFVLCVRRQHWRTPRDATLAARKKVSLLFVRVTAGPQPSQFLGVHGPRYSAVKERLRGAWVAGDLVTGQ